MQANPNDEMDQLYKDLTEKQRAVIDAHAQNPDATNREKARIAGEEILGQDSGVNESYSSEIINSKYPELAEYRVEIEQNERRVGQEETIGNPFESIEQGQRGFQTIKDRPVKQTQPEQEEPEPEPEPQVQSQSVDIADVQVQDGGDGVVLKISYGYVEKLIQDQDTQLPPELHKRLVDVIFQRAFNAPRQRS